MRNLLKNLGDQSPTLVVIASILFLVYLIFKEYQKARRELDEQVERAVDARLGAALSSVQEMTVQLEGQAKKTTVLFETSQLETGRTLAELKSKEAEINLLFD